MDTAAVDALVGEWPQLEAPTEHTQGQREGTRGSQIIGMRQKGGEFEALEQLRLTHSTDRLCLFHSWVDLSCGK